MLPLSEEIKVDYNMPKPPKSLKGCKESWLDHYKPEYADQAARLSAVGFSVKDLAYNFGVTEWAIRRWKECIPEFKQACDMGKHFQLKKLVAKGLMEAAGYDYQSKKTRVIKSADGTVQKIEETIFDNHQPANNNLLLFLVCNLSHQLGLPAEEMWQSKQKMEIEQKNLQVEITGKVAAEQIERLAGALIDGNKRKAIDSKVVDES